MSSERQEQIMAYLMEHYTATVHRLAETVYASEATIRRDLAALERSGQIRRTFGGAVISETLNREVPLTLREQRNIEAKNTIARRALQYISDGNTIFLDASSTTYHLVRYLSKFKDLTVITNGPQTSLALGALRINNICTGGTLLPDSVAYVGKYTCDFLRKFNPDVIFFSCRGVTDQGMLCDSSLEESHVREAMLSCRGQHIFLCDSSKFGQLYRYNFSHLSHVDAVVCESETLPDPFGNMLG